MRVGLLLVGAGAGYLLGNEEARHRMTEATGRIRRSPQVQVAADKLRKKVPVASDVEDVLFGDSAARGVA